MAQTQILAQGEQAFPWAGRQTLKQMNEQQNTQHFNYTSVKAKYKHTHTHTLWN